MKKALVAIAFAVAGLNAHATNWIDHDKVVAILEGKITNGAQRSAFTFRPYLYVETGCVPFPAVDWWGNVGGGLKPTGNPSSNCGHSTGQIYVRSGWYNGVFAIMYSWYMPKDEPSPGIGHRHDWENVVVWINNPEATRQTINGISVSGHGGYSTYAASNIPAYVMSGTHPKIKYYSAWPLDHQLGINGRQGGTQPLVFWEQLSTMAHDALRDTDFGKANVPFKDGNFERNLGKAWYR